VKKRKLFKSEKPVLITTERGTDSIQTEGEVIKIEGNRVYLKGLCYDFSISKKDFEKFNLIKN